MNEETAIVEMMKLPSCTQIEQPWKGLALCMTATWSSCWECICYFTS